MTQNVIVWDLETVPDLGRWAAANGLVGKTDEELRDAHGEGRPMNFVRRLVCIVLLFPVSSISALAQSKGEDRKSEDTIRVLEESVSPGGGILRKQLEDGNIDYDTYQAKLNSAYNYTYRKFCSDPANAARRLKRTADSPFCETCDPLTFGGTGQPQDYCIEDLIRAISESKEPPAEVNPYLPSLVEAVKRAEELAVLEPKDDQQVEAVLESLRDGRKQLDNTGINCKLETESNPQSRRERVSKEEMEVLNVCDRAIELGSRIYSKIEKLEGTINARPWRQYAAREKTLLEQVLNYTTTGDLDGHDSDFYVSGENGHHKCVLTRRSSHSSSSSSYDIRGMTPDGWTVREVIDGRNQYYVVGDEKKQFRGPITLSVERLQKAWAQAFKECPAGKAKPF